MFSCTELLTKVVLVAEGLHSLLPQAMAFPQLCSLLVLAEVLHQLVLDLQGRAADVVPTRLRHLGYFTQLGSLQLQNAAIAAKSKHLNAALSPLTRLMRLSLQLDRD